MWPLFRMLAPAGDETLKTVASFDVSEKNALMDGFASIFDIKHFEQSKLRWLCYESFGCSKPYFSEHF